MKIASKRELNQRTADVLARVTETEDLVITERGVPRWRVSIARQGDGTLARLEREGRYTPPSTDPAPWPSRPGGPAYTDVEATALLDEMRGEH